MNIDFIKWMVGYAEGFQIINRDIVALGWQSSIGTAAEGNDFWNSIYHPLLLQRAIEGWNDAKKNLYKIPIDQSRWYIEVNQKSFETDENTTYDQAKEKALKYIYNREGKRVSF